VAQRTTEGREFVIRRFDSQDRELVWELHSCAVGSEADAGDEFFSDLKDIENHFFAVGGEFLVGFVRDRLVAMGGFVPRSATEVEIKRMRVHPEWQHRGFGRAVLKRLEEDATSQSYSTLVIETTLTQISALAFYENNGYVEVERGTRVGFKVVRMRKSVDS